MKSTHFKALQYFVNNTSNILFTCIQIKHSSLVLNVSSPRHEENSLTLIKQKKSKEEHTTSKI